MPGWAIATCRHRTRSCGGGQSHGGQMPLALRPLAAHDQGTSGLRQRSGRRHHAAADQPVSDFLSVPGILSEPDFDKQALEIVQNLFARFVLDRLGGMYGECNRTLEDAGFYNIEEQAMVSSA